MTTRTTLFSHGGTKTHGARQRVDGKPGRFALSLAKGDRAGALWAAREQRLIHSTEPKLRVSAAPCETLLLMALCLGFALRLQPRA